MATMVKLLMEKENLIGDMYSRTIEAENEREREVLAAVKIQSWFRGQRNRAYLRFLDASAVLIQRKWRGFLGRRTYRERLKDRVFEMKVHHFNSMATKIQKVWKGFYTRKYVFNYYSRKRYLEGLLIKNEIIRSELADYEEQQEQQNVILAEERDRKRLEQWANKHHHLISTQAQPGVYNSPFQPYPDEMEYHLRNAKPKPSHSQKDGSKRMFNPTCQGYDTPAREPLPPIHPKPQGPFRSSAETQRQRYKPFKPTLRVQTPFSSVEEARQNMKDQEWVARLHDDTFRPFSKTRHQVTPTLHQSSKYEPAQYGMKHFREEYVDKFVAPQIFQTTVPPIPLFDKLNDTYSQGEV